MVSNGGGGEGGLPCDGLASHPGGVGVRANSNNPSHFMLRKLG